jgi:hypothetical protein
MTERFAIYYAPAQDSSLWRKAEAWLAQPDIQEIAVSARRYGFHATIKAPMALADGVDREQLVALLRRFAEAEPVVELSDFAPRLIDGFLAFTTEPQPVALTDFASNVVNFFEPARAPLSADDMRRRLKAQLTPRQVALVEQYGYPYVLEQFQFHMTLTDRLPVEKRDELQRRAVDWFAEVLAKPVMLDRLVLFHEAAAGEPFRRLDGDFLLKGPA